MPKIDISLGNLVDMIARGELRLPELQRRYVWPATRVRDLLDSLYRGYPSGTILVWETDRDVPEKDLAVQQAQSAFHSHKLLLDGQQRLTSMSAVLRGEPIQLKNRVRPIEIAFNVDHPEGPPTEVVEVEDDAPSANGETSDEADTAGLDNRSVQERVQNFTFVVAWRALLSDPRWIKVSDIFDSNKSDWQLLKPLGLSPDDPKYDFYSKRIQSVRAIRSYPYVMQVLERDLSYEEVAEIFVRVNSLGMKLRGSDLALAQITARWPNSLELFEAFAEECEKVWFTFDLGLLIRTLVVFATKQSRFRTVGRIPVPKLQEAWEEAKTGLRFAVNFLRQNAGIEDESLLSSPFFVIPIAVYAVLTKQRFGAQEERELLHWLFVANANAHYSGSSETTLDRDLNVLFRGGSPDFRGGSPNDLMEQLKQQLVRIRFQASDFAGRNWRNPLYATTYLALRHAGAKDWWTGLGISLTHSGQYHYIQTHHIFPQSVLRQAGFEAAEINEIANLAFIGGNSNRSLGSKTPDVYLPPILEKRGQPALEAQCIPQNEELWKIERYRQFLEVRRKLLADAVNAFLDDVLSEDSSGATDVASVISAGEGDVLEFKETARLNLRTGQVDKEIQKAVVKTVGGFFNSQGGTLVIGVNDAGLAVGLDRDFATLGSRPDADGYEQFLRTLLNNAIGKDACAQVRVSFPMVDGVQVCLIRVPATAKPVFVTDGANQQFFVRSGNTTQSLNLREAHEYCEGHFG
jgi:hypothetical protein